MSNIIKSIYNIRLLDELGVKKTSIHELHPVVKLLVTIIYLVIVLSFGKYKILELLPYVFYPMILFVLSEVPFFEMFKRFLIVLPLVMGIGIFNPLFDTKALIVISEIAISGGWISFASLVLKCSLTVFAGLLLIATTGIEKIALALRRLYVPKVFVLQFLLTYRYISVLIEEGARIIKAYQLRAPMDRGISFRAWGSLLGQMLLRALDRANRVYNAMLLRGFHGEYSFGEEDRVSISSILYLCGWTSFFIVARFFNLPEMLEKILLGVFR